MITTVTLSPCIDKTVLLADFDAGKVNRAESTRLDVGGKGINVSLALAALGVPSRAIGLNFESGERVEDTLKAAGVQTDFIRCRGQLRTNTKIYVKKTGNTIEINEQNPEVHDKAVAKVIELCSRVAKDRENSIFVFSGSIPPGVPEDIYLRLANAVKDANPSAKIILDTVGKPLLEGMKSAPCLIKPNVEELEKTFNTSLLTDEETVLLCREMIKRHGIGAVLVSNGQKGATAVTELETISSPAIKITPKSAQGAGDAMVAGACYALSKDLPIADVLRYGLAAAAGAVELEGTAFCGRERFEELLAER